MKKILSIIAGLLITAATYAQPYFQGTFVKDPGYATNRRIIFRMNPTATLTTAISYMEFSFRIPTSGTAPFTVANITSNTTLFPGLNMQRFPPDFLSGGFTYIKFVHNTATIASRTYIPDVNGFDVFTITLDGPPGIIPQADMASDVLGAQNFLFAVVDGAANFIDPGAGNQLYGPGFNINGGIHLLPLTNLVVPVKFTAFSATKKDNDALLTWTVENEIATTDRYEIERSIDGNTFDKIATLARNINNTNTSKTYNTVDPNLSITKKSGLIYYRIKQLDLDGRVVYSDIKSVRMGDNGGISVFPNPAHDFTNLSIDATNAGLVVIDLMSADGKQISTNSMQVQKGTNIKRISTNNLPAGTYLMRIKIENEIQVIKLTKL